MWAQTSMDALTGNGWGIVNPNGYATVLLDLFSPLSPPGIGQWKYPSGFAGGQAEGADGRHREARERELEHLTMEDRFPMLHEFVTGAGALAK